MLKVTWRNLVARKVRLALSAFAIVLGVAFVAGSFIFTDSLGGAFDGIIKGTTADVEVRPRARRLRQLRHRQPHDFRRRWSTSSTRLPEAAAADGTDQVQGVFVIGSDGKLVGGNGPPGFAFNYNDMTAITGEPDPHPGRGRAARRARARSPSTSDTADKAGYDIGDEVTLVTPGDPPTMKAELTGLVKFGSEGGLVGATITIFDDQAIQDLFFDGKDVYTNISLTAADGVSQAELRDAARTVIPEGVEAGDG